MAPTNVEFQCRIISLVLYCQMQAPFKAFDIGTVSLVRCNAPTVYPRERNVLKIYKIVYGVTSLRYLVNDHINMFHSIYCSGSPTFSTLFLRYIYRLRVTFIIFLTFLYIFSFHPTVKVKVNATFPVHLSREYFICLSRHKREPFSHALIFPAQTFPRWQPHRYIQSTWIIYH